MNAWIMGVNNEVSYKRLMCCMSRKNFSIESLWTYSCEVEPILNKFLLFSVSDAIHELEVIMAKHLLIGYQNNHSNTDLMHASNDLCVQWKDIQASANMFWNCWLKHYLPIPAIKSGQRQGSHSPGKSWKVLEFE